MKSSKRCREFTEKHGIIWNTGFPWSICELSFTDRYPPVIWQARKLVWRLVNGGEEKGGAGMGQRKKKKKKEHSEWSQTLHLSAPLPPLGATYFLTVLVRVMVLIPAQRSVHIFRVSFFQNLSTNSYRLPLIFQAIFLSYISNIFFLVTCK